MTELERRAEKMHILRNRLMQELKAEVYQRGCQDLFDRLHRLKTCDDGELPEIAKK